MGCNASVDAGGGIGGPDPGTAPSHGPMADKQGSSPPSPPNKVITGFPTGSPNGTLGGLPLLSGWECDHHGIGCHDAFVSYRVACEGAAGNGLAGRVADAIEAPRVADGGIGGLRACVFWDARCLNSGESWELGLKNGLEGASLVMPLVSVGALQGMIEHAAARRDNLLMEWEIALERQRLGLCLVLPIFVEDVGADGMPRRVDFSEATYPDDPHFLSKISIRTTLVALFKFQGVRLTLDRSGAPDPVQLAEAVRQVRRLLGSQELRTMRHRAQQEYLEERGRKAQTWKRVEAIIDGNDVIGRGASSVVYRGKLIPTEPDESDPPVAVKALRAEAVAASKQFTTELEIMKGLKVKTSIGVHGLALFSFCYVATSLIPLDLLGF